MSKYGFPSKRSDFSPASCGASILCPQKQCLSGKEDGLSGLTNQRLLPSRFACHLPPGGRLCCRPTVHQKGVTHYTLQSKACEKEYEQIVRTPFVVGRGFISRRFVILYRLFSAAASHRPTILRQVNLLYGRHPFDLLFSGLNE